MENKFMFISVNNEFVKINYDDILYFNSTGDYIKIITINNVFTIHFRIKNLIEKLNSETFIRVHRCYIVNINKINSISKGSNKTIYIDKIQIPISSTFEKEFLSKINLINKKC